MTVFRHQTRNLFNIKTDEEIREILRDKLSEVGPPVQVAYLLQLFYKHIFLRKSTGHGLTRNQTILDTPYSYGMHGVFFAIAHV
jgi:hypothetical protein